MAPKKVVIVDDDQENVTFLQELISDTPFEADGYTVPSEALAAMKESPPALAILDVQIPGPMNGLQLLQAMRDTKVLSQIPVMMLSAIGSVTGEEYTPEVIEKQYQVRPDAFLPKPIDPAQVRATIERLVR